MKLYQVTAQCVRVDPRGWRSSVGVPMFYLRDDIQGIVNADHAEQIARRMLKELAPDATFHIGIGVSEDFDPTAIGA